MLKSSTCKLIFGIALLLRFALCLLNREANDDHMEVINLIADKGIIPGKDDCAECFQPKFFYLFHAKVIELFNISNLTARLVYVQLVNFIFSFLILLISLKIIESVKTTQNIQLISFSLLALNPCFTGINAQATNDTMITLLGSCCIYFAVMFLNNKKIMKAAWLILFILLSSIVKGSGLIIFISIFLILLLKLFFAGKSERKLYSKTLLCLTILYAAIVPFAGGYYKEFKKTGTPFATGIGPSATPKENNTFKYRPGITSVASGYLTFRYWDMLKHPYITNDVAVYPVHRTSLWSQLYGRTFFMHFDQHPPSWQSKNSSLLIAGRILLTLGIVPVLIFILGFLKLTARFVQGISKNTKQYLQMNNDWTYLVFIIGYVLFIVKYSHDYPDFSTMKSIFLFPAIPAFVKIITLGFAEIKNLYFLLAAKITTLIIIVLSVFDICFLIRQLYFVNALALNNEGDSSLFATLFS